MRSRTEIVTEFFGNLISRCQRFFSNINKFLESLQLQQNLNWNVQNSGNSKVLQFLNTLLSSVINPYQHKILRILNWFRLSTL